MLTETLMNANVAVGCDYKLTANKSDKNFTR